MKNTMKTAVAACFLACIAALCCSCSSVQFSSVKEVEKFVMTERTKPAYVKYGAQSALISTSRRDNILAPPAMPVIGHAWKMQIYGIMSLNRSGVIYRDVPGEPKLNVILEAKKRAGTVPESEACEFEGLLLQPGYAEHKYKGSDGVITVANSLYGVVNFSGKTNPTVKCTKETWKVYEDYLLKVLESAKEIVMEDEATRFQTVKKVKESN